MGSRDKAWDGRGGVVEDRTKLYVAGPKQVAQGGDGNDNERRSVESSELSSGGG